MTDINIVNEPCACPPGQCMHFVEDDAHCINRLDGDVRTLRCISCKSHTWHQNGECLRCRRSPTPPASRKLDELNKMDQDLSCTTDGKP